MNSKILSYFRELSIVIIGISVAFAINKWSDSIKSENLKNKVLENMLSDLESNNFQIHKAKEANELMISQYDSLISLIENDSDISLNINFYVSKVVMASTSLELAISMGVLSDVSFDLARDISFCFKLQSDLLEFEKAFFDYLEVKEENRLRYYKKARSKAVNYNNAIISLDQTQSQLIEDIKLTLGKVES